MSLFFLFSMLGLIFFFAYAMFEIVVNEEYSYIALFAILVIFFFAFSIITKCEYKYRIVPITTMLWSDSLYVITPEKEYKFEKMSDINKLKDKTEMVLEDSYNFWGGVIYTSPTDKNPDEIRRHN